jgi:predicted CoA-binding protein
VPAIVESCIKLGIKNLWLQDGVIHDEAALRAQQDGIRVVMDRCMARDFAQLFNATKQASIIKPQQANG